MTSRTSICSGKARDLFDAPIGHENAGIDDLHSSGDPANLQRGNAARHCPLLLGALVGARAIPDRHPVHRPEHAFDGQRHIGIPTNASIRLTFAESFDEKLFEIGV
nr:hypothetical protein [Marinicella sp. W31]MDC2880267.1 hypothetical protein [Marinicella sp. W31]